MSHVVQIKTEIRDINAVRQACLRLQLEAPTQGTFQLYSSQESGYGVKLRDWKYPVVCKLESGEVRYDNYGGRWGNDQRWMSFCNGTRLRNRNWKPASRATPPPRKTWPTVASRSPFTPEAPHETH